VASATMVENRDNLDQWENAFRLAGEAEWPRIAGKQETGVLKRENVKARMQNYVAAHTHVPTQFRKFGGSPLVSLDEVLFEDGTATRGDTVSRGLWD